MNVSQFSIPEAEEKSFLPGDLLRENPSGAALQHHITDPLRATELMSKSGDPAGSKVL